jgi:hypothetical protein
LFLDPLTLASIADHVGMLGTLLRGLRHLRTPLASGAIWIAIAWLLWARHLPARSTATGLLADTYQLLAMLGQLLSLAILGFVAYIVGDIWIRVRFSWANTARWMRRLLRLPSVWRHKRSLVDRFSKEGEMFDYLLPKLGARRPTLEELTDEVRTELEMAMYHDLNRAEVGFWVKTLNSTKSLIDTGRNIYYARTSRSLLRS